MQKELIEKANEILRMIDEQEKAVLEFEKCIDKDVDIYIGKYEYDFQRMGFTRPIKSLFEDWEIRLMIHNKKQRIKALKEQLERL